MLFAVLAWLAAGVCVYVGAARARRVAVPDGADELARALRRADRATASRVLAGSDAGRRAAAYDALAEVLAAPTRAHAVAVINESLSDVSSELDGAGEIPRAAARIAIAIGTALALLRIASGLGSDGPWLGWAVAAFAGGMAAAGVCLGLARRAERVARDRREAWNRLSGRLAALAPPGPGALASEGAANTDDSRV